MNVTQRDILIIGAGIGAYVLVRALRPHASKLGVVAEPGAPAAAKGSKYVDYHETLPGPESDAYARIVLEVARRRGVTHVVPIKEREMLALAPFHQDFTEQGIILCCSDFDVLRRVSNKSLVLSLAEDYLVPVPQLCQLRPQREQPASKVNPFGYPVIVKATRSWGSSGVRLVHSPMELDVAAAELERLDAGASIHEYVPGGIEPSLTAFVAGDGRMLIQIWLRKLRYAGPSHSCCVVTTAPPAKADRVASFLSGVGLRGPVGVQLKLSDRTGEIVLIEVNPRLGQNARILTRICQRVGIDFGSVFLACFEGDQARRQPHGVPEVPPGLVGVSAPEDLLALVKYASARLRPYERADNPLPDLFSYLRSYVDVYRRRPVLDLLSASVLDDPKFVAPAVLGALFRLRRARYRLVPFGDVGYLRGTRM